MATLSSSSSSAIGIDANKAEGTDLELQKDFSVEVIRNKLDELKRMFDDDICGPLLERAKQVIKEKEEFEAEKEKHRDPDATMEDIVKLDIGGKFFDIKRKHLCRIPDSRLAKIFNGDFKINVAEKTKRTFLDRDYTHFHIIQAYLEEGDYKSMLPTDPLDIKRLSHECDYYQLAKLKEEVEAQKEASKRR
eukprot:EG_transcript_27717